MPVAGGQNADYQIVVSRASERPMAERYAFNLRDRMPKFPLPLKDEDIEPVVDLQKLVEQVCQNTMIDIDIDYADQPRPALSEKDFAWMQTLPAKEPLAL